MPAMKCPFCSREIPERKQKTLTGRVRCPGCGSIGPLSELAALGEGRLPKGVTEREDGSVLHVSSLSAWSLPAVAAVPAALLFFIVGFRSGGISGIVFLLFAVMVSWAVWGGALRQPRDSPDSRRVCLPARIAEKGGAARPAPAFQAGARPVPQRQFLSHRLHEEGRRNALHRGRPAAGPAGRRRRMDGAPPLRFRAGKWGKYGAAR